MPTQSLFRFGTKWAAVSAAGGRGELLIPEQVALLDQRDRALEDYITGLDSRATSLESRTTVLEGRFPVSAANGGTGQTTYTIGDLLYASGAAALSKLAGVATGNALISGGVGTAPSWGKIGLGTHVSGTLALGSQVSGTLPVGNGGTGTTTAGAGSGYDADLLDGQHGSYYQDVANLTNAAPTSYTPTWGGITLGNGTSSGGYTLLGPLCFFYAYLRIGSTTTRAATQLSATLPVTARTISAKQELVGLSEVRYIDNTTGSSINWKGAGKFTTTLIECHDYSNNAQGTDDTNSILANGTDPFGAAWATDDQVMIDGWFWRA